MSIGRRLSDRPPAIFLLVLILCAAGAWTATRLPSAIFPTVTFPRVKVIAEGAEEPAVQMIPAVTRPLEEAILRVPGIERVISTSTRGSVEIGAEFSWGTDMQLALQRVQAEISRTRPDLPADLRVDAEWMNTAVFPILGYALTSDTRSQAELRELADFVLRPALIQIPGVSQVQVQGGRLREFQVRLEPEKLAARKLSAADVVDSIRKNNVTSSAGLVEANHELYLSLVTGKPAGIDDLSRIAVPPPKGGVASTLGQLGEISAEDAVSFIRTTADRRPAVLVNVVRQPAASTLAIAAGIAELFRTRPELLPKDVKWTTFYDQATYVRESVHGVRDAILIGVLLASIVLFAYLRNFKITLIAVATIPVTVAIVFLGLSAFGQTVNLMTLGGIAAAIGLVVDDAIVVVESIARHAEEGLPDPVRTGLAESLPPLVGSSISTVVIFFPLALLSGVAGAFFRPLALTMGMALTISAFLSAFAVPSAAGALRAASKPRQKKSRDPRIARFFIRHPSVSLGVVVLLLVGGWLLYGAIGSDFLPAMDEGSIVLDYWTPPGTSLTDSDQMLSEVEKLIASLPDVATYSRRTGAELGFFVTEPNRGDFLIHLKPRKSRRGVEEVMDELRTKIAASQPAIRAEFGQVLEDVIGDLSGGVPQPIDVKIYGEDQAILLEKARAAGAIVEKISGVEDVFNGITVAGPKLSVRVIPEALPRFGVTAESLLSEVEPAVGGTVAGNLLIRERLYDIRVFSRNPAVPVSVDALRSLPVQTASGARVPLSALAEVSTGTPEVEIQRENLRSYLGVTARLSGRSLGSAVSDIRSRLASGLALPPGMSLAFGGLYEQQQSSFKGLLGVLFGGLLLVAVVVLFQFGDWRAPFLTVVVALTVLTSVLGSLIVTGMTLNISSFVGAIMMVGIVGEKAVFLIHDAREELRRGLSVQDAWAEASRKRLRAVMMTIFSTAFALAPLAIALGEGSQLQQPLAIAVIGGFILSSPLVLLILPSLYAWMDPKGRLAGRRIAPETHPD